MPDASKSYVEFGNVSVAVLFDLEDMLQEEGFLGSQQAGNVARVVLKWAVDRGFLGQHAPPPWPYPPRPTMQKLVTGHYAEDKQEDDPIAREIRAVLDGVVVAKGDPEAVDVGASVSVADADAVAPTAVSEVEGADVSTAAPLASIDAVKDAPAAPIETKDNAQPGIWSEDEIATLLRLKNAGKTAREIAEALPGRTQSAIYTRLKMLRDGEQVVANTSGPAEPASKPVEAVVQPQGPDVQRDMPASGSMAVAGAPGCPTWWRAVEIHLNGIGYANGWTADADYELVEMLSRGESWFVVADQLGRAKPDMVARYRDLIFGDGMEAQSRTLQVLRSRAGIEG